MKTTKQKFAAYGALSLLFSVISAGPQAAPLPDGATLDIGQGLYSSSNVPCVVGSCFGLEVTPGIVSWINVGPGTDGGLIVGKNQVSGSSGSGPGVVTSAFYYNSGYGTFFTPQGSSNIYSDTSCVGANCLGQTELRSWNMAWRGTSIPLGSADGCLSFNCSVDQLAGLFVTEWTIGSPAGSPYTLKYGSVIPDGDPSGRGNVPFKLILRGIQTSFNQVKSKPIAHDGGVYLYSSPSTPSYEVMEVWIPRITYNGTGKLRCFIVIQPPFSNSKATIAPDCGWGTYWRSPSNSSESFTYAVCDETSCDYANMNGGGGAGPGTCGIHSEDHVVTVTENTTVYVAGGYTIRPGCNITSSYIEVSKQPLHGTATLSGAYTPDPGYTGSDYLEYTIYGTYDNVTYSAQAIGTIAITVKPAVPPSVPPVARDLSVVGISATNANWRPNVVDPDEGPSPLTCRLDTLPINGTATVAADCSAGTYQSTPGFVGEDSFTYIANDGVSDSNIAAVTATIHPALVSGSPLPAGTLLPIVGGVGSSLNKPCSVGSCIGFEFFPGLVDWIDIYPGSDGGFIVGKTQQCINTTSSGELTYPWSALYGTGTLCTDPGGELNLFSDTTCFKDNCLGQTELNNFFISWQNEKIKLSPYVDEYIVDDIVNGSWQMRYSRVFQNQSLWNSRFYAILRGTTPCTGLPIAKIHTLPSRHPFEPGNPSYIEPGDTITIMGGDSNDPCGDPLTYSWHEDAVEFSADATTSKTYTGLPDVYTVGLTVTDQQGQQGFDSVDIKVGPPHVNGFWPNAANAGEIVFIFGENFKTASGALPTACFDTSCSSLNQLLSDDLMLTIVPAGVSIPTSIPLHVNTDVATGTSLTSWGTSVDGLSINGIWPAKASAGDIVFVFGSGFDTSPGSTQLTINGQTSFLTQVQDSTLLLTIVPAGATSGPVCITAFDLTTCGALDLEIVP